MGVKGHGGARIGAGRPRKDRGDRWPYVIKKWESTLNDTGASEEARLKAAGHVLDRTGFPRRRSFNPEVAAALRPLIPQVLASCIMLLDAPDPRVAWPIYRTLRDRGLLLHKEMVPLGLRALARCCILEDPLADPIQVSDKEFLKARRSARQEFCSRAGIARTRRLMRASGADFARLVHDELALKRSPV